MSGPLVSVIVPTFNRSALLSYTLRSIYQQKLAGASLEVIVVDDGSTDDTAAVVSQYAGQGDLQYHYQPNQGRRVARARNLGIEHARGSICLFIDSGVLLGSHCIAQHVRSHLSCPQAAAVLGYVYCFDNGNQEGALLQQVIDPHHPDRSIEAFRLSGRHLDLREGFYVRYRDNLADLPFPWVFFWTCNVSVQTNALRAVGAFDVAYDQNWGMEDIDLGYRLHQAGVTTLLNRNAHSIHYPHDKDEAENLRQQAINKQLFHHKYNTPETELFLKYLWEMNDLSVPQYASKQPLLYPTA
jgi:glycosyltransferase involved in cell wall biosynthesis